MNNSMRILSLILAVLMGLSLLSGTAFAEEGRQLQENTAAVINLGTDAQIEKTSLADAISAAGKGDTVTLVQKKLTISGALVITRDLVLDLGGNSLELHSDAAQPAAMLVSNGAAFTLRNGALSLSGKGFASGVKAESGSAVLAGVTLTGECGQELATGEAGNLTVIGGSYDSDPTAFLAQNQSCARNEQGRFLVSEKPAEPVQTEEPAAPAAAAEPAEEPAAGEEPGEEQQPEETEEPGEGEQPGTGEVPGEGEQPGEENPEEPQEPVKGIALTEGGGSVQVEYRKGSGAADSLRFTVTPAFTELAVYPVGQLPADGAEAPTGTVLHTDYAQNDAENPAAGGCVTLSLAENAQLLEGLAAGEYVMEFRFTEAEAARGRLRVYLAASVSPARHVKGSGETLTVTLTDTPSRVVVSDNAQLSPNRELTPGTDYTLDGSTLTLSAAFLDSLADDKAEVTRYLAFPVDYSSGAYAVPYAVVIAPAPSIDPHSRDWKVNAGDISFQVKPDVTGVSVDGTVLDSKQYAVKEKTLTIKANSAFKGLSYGEHTLTVTTGDGSVSATVKVLPSLGYVSTNQHTKDGSRDLQFVASSPITEVWINKAKLTADQYTLSADGKTVTVKAAALNALSVGSFTLNVSMTEGGKTYSASAPFQIISRETAGKNPKTGDSADLVLWSLLLAGSGAGCALLAPRKRRQ